MTKMTLRFATLLPPRAHWRTSFRKARGRQGSQDAQVATAVDREDLGFIESIIESSDCREL
jgi:hypothetical protein